jgi:DNA-binding Lrp family transcriptional regulator
MELMVYDSTGTPHLDGMDMRIIGALIDDYLLSQSKEGLSLQLGISRANFGERLDQLESTGVIRPTLGVKAEKMAQVVLRIPLTESQVLNALMRLPVAFFSLIESRDTGEREWLVFVKCPYTVAEMLTNSNWSKGISLTSYSAQRLAFQSQRQLFASYDSERNGWRPELFPNRF